MTEQKRVNPLIINDVEGLRTCLLKLDQAVHFFEHDGLLLVDTPPCDPEVTNHRDAKNPLLTLPPLPIEQLGDRAFQQTYAARYSYYAGSMAHAISSENMVIQMGKQGFLASFGAGGLPPARLERAIQQIINELPHGPYAFNLIFNPNEPALERQAVELYLQHGVNTIEASAFLDITLPLVQYRVSGLSQLPDGSIHCANRVIAKLSRREVASRFMQPAPQDILDQLLQQGSISEVQASLALHVPLANDITVEADSGGHTDNRPLLCLLPSIISLRDEMQCRFAFEQAIRVGAAGGISTPESALAAFSMGAAYIVTGSVNQACIESGASQHTRRLLAQAEMTDMTMAPAGDMFEMGVRVQVLKRGTMFPMRAQKLYELYKSHDSIESILAVERVKIEKQIFLANLDEIWQQTVSFFKERDASQIERAEKDAKYRMALIFRWYLGQSSHWSNRGEKGREMDYQIWCGPSMGSFNDWVRGTSLEEPENRRVVEVARHILSGAAYLARIQMAAYCGIPLPASLHTYKLENTS